MAYGRSPAGAYSLTSWKRLPMRAAPEGTVMVAGGGG